MASTNPALTPASERSMDSATRGALAAARVSTTVRAGSASPQPIGRRADCMVVTQLNPYNALSSATIAAGRVPTRSVWAGVVRPPAVPVAPRGRPAMAGTMK